jgi:hypothetical protein
MISNLRQGPIRLVTVAMVMVSVLVPSQPAIAKDEPPVAAMPVSTYAALANCPEIVFIKRHHIRTPFGIGTKAVSASLTAGLDYWLAVDSFTESGVIFGRNVVSGGKTVLTSLPVSGIQYIN